MKKTINFSVGRMLIHFRTPDGILTVPKCRANLAEMAQGYKFVWIESSEDEPRIKRYAVVEKAK